jgi:hypothetical protein
VNGTCSLSNNFQFEGVNNNQRAGLLQVYIPPVEAIEEVNVTTAITILSKALPWAR